MSSKGISKKTSPSLTLIATGLSFIIFFTYLGFWQLNRAEEKDTAFNKIKTQMTLPPISINSITDWNAVLPYQKVSVTGQFVSKNSVLIDNILFDGKPGYHVITAFKLDGFEQYLPINRGWISGTQSRSILPTFETKSKTITLNGYLKEFQPALPFFSETGESIRNKDDHPLWLYFNLEAFKVRSDLPLSPYMLILNPAQGSVFQTNNFEPKSKQGMHIGYAIQWFIFALFIFILTVKVIFSNPHNKQEIQISQ